MSQYDKLTVVKLKDELNKRGLPKTGLKAALVERLVNADAQADQAPSSEPQAPPEPPEPPAQQEPDLQVSNGERDDVAKATLPPVNNVQDQQARPVETIDVTASTEQEQQRPQNPSASTEDVTATLSRDVSRSPPPGASKARPVQEEVIHPSPSAPQEPILPVASEEGKILEGDATTDAVERAAADSSKEELVAAEPPRIAEQVLQDTPALSAQTSTVGGEELRADTNKRKRRSQSPPPSSIETSQKRAKAEDGRPQVTLPEDETIGTKWEKGDQDASMEDAPIQQPLEQPQEATPTNDDQQAENQGANEPIDTETTGQGSRSPPASNHVEAKLPVEEREPTPPSTTKLQSPLKPSPTDTRFKNLFTAPSKREASPTRPSVQADQQDRVVPPALHPATPALYIRDFMRPLNPQNLKDYLIALASPPDSDPDPEALTEFFLDSVRTHCLVNFTNTAAASRVRSGLHDRVWPDEKTRKPLWVDFVPEEKLKKWIEVETEAASDRKQGMKKWEVVYEDEKGDIMAYLQEAGSNSNAPRTVQAALPRAESGAGVQGAPTGPRSKDAAPAAKPDRGKAFGALDDLFSSTSAKPKLYYLPVSKDVVDKRLERFAEGRGGGRGDEMRRYSFEDGSLVDKGPEFGMRGRGGGFGGRGGSYRGYGGRGGGYRGDTWRR